MPLASDLGVVAHTWLVPPSGGESTPADPELGGEVVGASAVDRRVELAQQDASRLQLDGRRRAVTGGGAARSMCVTARSKGHPMRGGDSGSR